MSRRFFIGPNGARFSREDPLPDYVVGWLESGEITEVTDGAATVAPSASDSKPRPSRPKGATKPAQTKKASESPKRASSKKGA